MNTALYIAKRYLISKKTYHLINVISRISTLGVTIGTMALIVVLSVFNGFEGMVVSLFSSFDPDYKITSTVGKTFNLNHFPTQKLKNIKGIKYFDPVLEENALLCYNGKQHIATIKGVNKDFQKMSGIDTMMESGQMMLERGDADFAVLGSEIAYNLGVNLNDFTKPIDVYIPKRGDNFGTDPLQSFTIEPINAVGVFSVQPDFNSKYMLVPYRFAARLLDKDNQCSAIELGIDKNVDKEEIRSQIEELIGDKYEVKSRIQLHDEMYKIMKSEKFAVFMILTFILIIAVFNVVGSLSMLIIEKKQDIAILKSMGGDNSLIKRIFLIEGTAITVIGAIAGLVLGFIICFVQQKFGIIKMAGGEMMAMPYFPVEMKVLDFVMVFFTVFAIGFIAAWIPVRQINRKYLKKFNGSLIQ